MFWTGNVAPMCVGVFLQELLQMSLDEFRPKLCANIDAAAVIPSSRPWHTLHHQTFLPFNGGNRSAPSLRPIGIRQTALFVLTLSKLGEFYSRKLKGLALQTPYYRQHAAANWLSHISTDDCVVTMTSVMSELWLPKLRRLTWQKSDKPKR